MSERCVQMLVCKPAAAVRDDFADPALPGWVLGNQAVLSCDGEFLRVQSANGQTWGYGSKPNISVDASKYKFLIVRLKGGPNAYFWLNLIVGGEWKYVQTEIPAPTDYTIYVYDLSSITSGIITAVYLGASGGVGKIVYYDFFLFTTEDPFYDVEDLKDVLDVPQLKNGLNGQSDYMSFVVDNGQGQNKTRFLYA